MTRTHEIQQARRFGGELAADGASPTELADAAEDAFGADRALLSAFWGVAQAAVSAGRNRALRGGLNRGRVL